MTAKYTYPHSIENGGGERLIFKGRDRDERGEFLVVENEVQPGAGPPMHVHFRQDEALTVVDGTIGWQLRGGPENFAGPGETVVFKAGIAHRFWAARGEVLRCTGWVRPPESIEYFLTEIYRSTREGGGHKPNDLDAAWLLHRYATEFDMPEIPVFVKTVVFPILRSVGSLTGRYSKYASAPEPAR